ncbi:MAG: DUF2155 domain-containing protein [Rickettsiales bacterium]|nr:DUF2155 domain-containing protein [Rickettsiales bacterium]
MLRYLLCLLFFFALPVQAQETIIAEESEDEIFEEEPIIQKNYTGMRFRGLNKVTTRSQETEATMGTVTRFGNLEIIPRGCWIAPPDKRPEQAGLMEVWYWKQGEKPSLVFYGWMFSSSPALSSLKHPVYDITMLECIAEEVEEEPAEAGETEAVPKESPNEVPDAIKSAVEKIKETAE